MKKVAFQFNKINKSKHHITINMPNSKAKINIFPNYKIRFNNLINRIQKMNSKLKCLIKV